MADWSQKFSKVTPQKSQPQTSQNGQSILNPILQTGGGLLGALGGGALGVAGGALVPGADLSGVPEAVGGYAGGVAGAGLGSGLGNEAANFINSLISKAQYKPTPNEDVAAGVGGAAGEAIGVPVAKGLGLVAHPIAPFINMVDKELARSPKVVDFAKLLEDYRQNVLPQLMQQGFGNTASEAYKKLSADVTGAVSAFKQVGQDNLPMGQYPKDVSSMELPISQANQLKRNLTKNLSKYYGGDTGQIDIEARKQFARGLKENIAKQEPGVNLPNKIASGLYGAEGLLNQAAKAAPFGLGKAAEFATSDIGRPIVQAMIPQGGGYLNQVVPRLLQLLISGAQQQ